MGTAKVDLKRIVREFVSRLEPEIHVKKVILYGSYARGRADEWSDIDLAVISDDLRGLDQLQRIVVLSPSRRGCDTSIEPLGFTMREYQTASHLTFLGEIKRMGKVIYEAK